MSCHTLRLVQKGDVLLRIDFQRSLFLPNELCLVQPKGGNYPVDVTVAGSMVGDKKNRMRGFSGFKNF